MKIFTAQKVSPRGKLNNTDLNKIKNNMIVFTVPILLIYLQQLTISLSGGVLDMQDLIPTGMTMGAIQAYVIATLIDVLKKLNNA